jgi:hypothetical protein
MTLKACFHAHDKRVRERHRGARTRSVRGLHQTCWLRQHAPRQRRETRLVVGVGATQAASRIRARRVACKTIIDTPRAFLRCFALQPDLVSKKLIFFKRACLAKCPNNRALAFMLTNVPERLDLMIPISNFLQTGTLAPNDAGDLCTDRSRGLCLRKPDGLRSTDDVELTKPVNVIGHDSQTKQPDIACEKFIHNHRGNASLIRARQSNGILVHVAENPTAEPVECSRLRRVLVVARTMNAMIVIPKAARITSNPSTKGSKHEVVPDRLHDRTLYEHPWTVQGAGRVSPTKRVGSANMRHDSATKRGLSWAWGYVHWPTGRCVIDESCTLPRPR